MVVTESGGTGPMAFACSRSLSSSSRMYLLLLVIPWLLPHPVRVGALIRLWHSAQSGPFLSRPCGPPCRQPMRVSRPCADRPPWPFQLPDRRVHKSPFSFPPFLVQV